jgi:predicted PurR-regulated permease PerM
MEWNTMDNIQIVEYILIALSSVSILFLISVGFVFKLMYELSNLKYELKLGKINCQKDLDRLEDKINNILSRDSKYYERELEKLEKIQQNLLKIVDDGVTDSVRSSRRILND